MGSGSREAILKRLEADLHGPLREDELLGGYPTDIYLTGILYPRNSRIAEEDQDQLQAEGLADMTSGDVGADEMSLVSVRRPASAGLSFVVENPDGGPAVISIEFNGAVYRRPEESSLDANQWARNPVGSKVEVVLEATGKPRDIGPQETGIPGLGLHVRAVPDGDRAVATVAMVNLNSPGKDYEKAVYEEMCFFQTQLTVRPVSATRLCPRHLKASAMDEDTRMAELIYRDVVEYAVGHTCSASWKASGGSVDSVRTDWLPHAFVKAMSSHGVAEFKFLGDPASGPVLSTQWLSGARGPELAAGLRRLPEAYGAWLEDRRKDIAGLPPGLRAQAELQIERALDATGRMVKAVEAIAADPDVEAAFRLANRAIMLQRAWSSGKTAPLVWFPFQLGFMLVALESVADEQSPDRDVADLLWFPTGGGKTEAYLGLTAFTLFLRRLRHGDHGSGVSCIMRYTLRLLTTQQFQRAAALVCACEHLRLGHDLPAGIPQFGGKTPFSLGLWVGGDATPNTYNDAVAALQDENAPSRPDQLKRCPRHTDAHLVWKAAAGRCFATCSDSRCAWHTDTSALPVWTVDEDVYRERPALVIGTIDKFAQIARKPETVALFASDGRNRRPDLIIQDELHLISGPLGTLAGIYEAAIDVLCSRDGARPKVVASTATIRQASDQIRALFDRRTHLFPPPALDAGNSGFAVEDADAPGRLYVGVTTAGRSAKFTLQATAASLLQASTDGTIPEGERDDFWTLVTYFNSLRELGGSLVLMQDDTPKSIDLYAGRRGEGPRVTAPPLELTSRVSQTEIKDILETLETACGSPGCCDILLSSNMISVGVDVPRLGMMIVNGQPKGIAEYIQATSRVGRRFDGPGGLVVTTYNNAKARDRSHFETFATWHAALYREVEATSVTPFAARARQKALHATIVVLARHLVSGLRAEPGAIRHHDAVVREFADNIADRAKSVDQSEVVAVEDALHDFIENWAIHADGMRFYWSDYRDGESLLISAERAAEIQSKRGTYTGRARPTPNSMRNVEASTLFRLKEGL